MVTPGRHLMWRTHRKVVILFYWILILSSLGASTAIRNLQCDGSITMGGERCPIASSIRSTLSSVASPSTWRNQILHAGAAAAARSDRGKTARRPEPKARQHFSKSSSSSTSTVVDEHDVSNSSTDYNIVSGSTCVGTHGLEVQQDNTTVYLRGLPVYHVSVINTCLECSLSDIHIACGDWASATEVNPQIFRRVTDNDCLVNDGKPISSQGVLYFEYSNSFPYPMDVRRAFPSCS